MAEPWTFSSPVQGYRGASIPWVATEPWRQAMASRPPSEAQRLIDAEGEVYDRLTSLQNQSKLQNLDRQLQFLRSFQPGQGVNLYGQPANQREAYLQALVDESIKGGNALIRGGQANEKVRYAADLQNVQLQRAAQQQALQRAQFLAQQRERNVDNILAARRLQQQAENEAQNRALRARSIAQSGQLGLQRMQQQSSLAQLNRAGQIHDRNYKEAAEAVQNGMDPEEAFDIFGLTDQGDMDRLVGYANMVGQEGVDETAELQTVADYLNRQRLAMLQDKLSAYTEGQSVAPQLTAKERAELEKQAFDYGGGAIRVGAGGQFEVVPVQPRRSTVPAFPEIWYQQMQRLGSDSKYPGMPVALTEEQRRQVPMGSRYVGPDGKVRVRQR